MEAARKVGKAVGIHEVSPDAEAVRGLLDEGFNFVACSIDTVYLGTSARKVAEKLKLLRGYRISP